MAHSIMSGLGYSRFLVERFNKEARVLEIDADDRYTCLNSVMKSALSSNEISRRSTAEEEVEVETDEAEIEAGVVGEARDEENVEVGGNFGVSMRFDETTRATQQSYEHIARIATHAAEQIDWRQLRNSTALWDEKKRVSASPNFTIYTRQSRGMHYVMAIGMVSCSVSELKSILRPTTNAKYRAVMVELYGDAFLDGSIRYQPRTSVGRNNNNSSSSGSRNSVHTRTGRSSTPRTAPGNRPSYRPRYRETTTSGAAPGLCHNSFMAKTATFAKSHVFAKVHEWSFLECFLENPGRSGFTVSMSSLGPFFGASESRGFYNRAKFWIGGPVEQLQGITAAYSVVPTADSRREGGGEVQVMFYSKFAEDSTMFGPFKRHTHKLALRSHLLQMARAATRLPIMVRRRRLEALSPSDNRAFTLSNPLCICCTTTLHFLKAKSRCHACGYFVCDKCSIEQEVEVEPQAPIMRARVCQPCIRRVDEAIYERASALDEFGTDLDAGMASKAPPPDAKSASMATVLDRIFHSGPEEKRQAVMSVIKYVLDDDASINLQQTRQDPWSRRQRQRRRESPLRPRASSLSSSLSSSMDSDSFANTDPHSEKDYLRALQNHLTASHTATISSNNRTSNSASATDRLARSKSVDGVCVYDDGDVGDFTGRCTNESRSHQDAPHLVPSQGRHATAAHVYPKPRNEAHRSKMAREQLVAIEDVSSLEIICSIASKELDCPVAMVTLVESDKTHVVASNSGMYRGVVVPRGESLCAYTVMAGDANRALVVPHPERDARFRDMALVEQQRLRFYCGFPVTSHDGSVVGALCCGDFAPADGQPSRFGGHELAAESGNDGRVLALTPQQTDAMTKLAATASKVMQLRGNNAYKRL